MPATGRRLLPVEVQCPWASPPSLAMASLLFDFVEIGEDISLEPFRQVPHRHRKDGVSFCNPLVEGHQREVRDSVLISSGPRGVLGRMTPS